MAAEFRRLQLRGRGVSQIVVAGMVANLCVQSQLRHLLEEGLEVAAIRDATAAPRLAVGDAYLAAVTSYDLHALAAPMTGEAVTHIREGA
jgi:nicotinamidase-related amidase